MAGGRLKYQDLPPGNREALLAALYENSVHDVSTLLEFLGEDENAGNSLSSALLLVAGERNIEHGAAEVAEEDGLEVDHPPFTPEASALDDTSTTGRSPEPPTISQGSPSTNTELACLNLNGLSLRDDRSSASSIASLPMEAPMAASLVLPTHLLVTKHSPICLYLILALTPLIKKVVPCPNLIFPEMPDGVLSLPQGPRLPEPTSVILPGITPTQRTTQEDRHQPIRFPSLPLGAGRIEVSDTSSDNDLYADFDDRELLAIPLDGSGGHATVPSNVDSDESDAELESIHFASPSALSEFNALPSAPLPPLLLSPAVAQHPTAHLKEIAERFGIRPFEQPHTTPVTPPAALDSYLFRPYRLHTPVPTSSSNGGLHSTPSASPPPAHPPMVLWAVTCVQVPFLGRFVTLVEGSRRLVKARQPSCAQVPFPIVLGRFVMLVANGQHLVKASKPSCPSGLGAFRLSPLLLNLPKVLQCTRVHFLIVRETFLALAVLEHAASPPPPPIFGFLTSHSARTPPPPYRAVDDQPLCELDRPNMYHTPSNVARAESQLSEVTEYHLPPPSEQAGPGTFYVVTVGHKVGVWADWTETAIHVLGCPSNVIRSYRTFDRAHKAFLHALQERKGKCGDKGERCEGQEEPTSRFGEDCDHHLSPHPSVWEADNLAAVWIQKDWWYGQKQLADSMVQCPRDSFRLMSSTPGTSDISLAPTTVSPHGTTSSPAAAASPVYYVHNGVVIDDEPVSKSGSRWASPEDELFLESWKAGFWAARESARNSESGLASFMQRLFERYWKERTNAVPFTPKELLAVGGDLEAASKLPTFRGRRVKRQKQLRYWLDNKCRATVDCVAASKGLKNLIEKLRPKANNLMKSCYAYERLYSDLNLKEQFKETVWKPYVLELLKHDQIPGPAVNQFAKWLTERLENETPEVKKAVEEYRQKVKQESDLYQLVVPATETERERVIRLHKSIQILPSLVQEEASVVKEMTGFVSFRMLGGPTPGANGALTIIVWSDGETADGVKFEDWWPLYEANIYTPFVQFLNLVFPPEVRAKVSLRVVANEEEAKRLMADVAAFHIDGAPLVEESDETDAVSDAEVPSKRAKAKAKAKPKNANKRKRVAKAPAYTNQLVDIPAGDLSKLTPTSSNEGGARPPQRSTSTSTSASATTSTSDAFTFSSSDSSSATSSEDSSSATSSADSSSATSSADSSSAMSSVDSSSATSTTESLLSSSATTTTESSLSSSLSSSATSTETPSASTAAPSATSMTPPSNKSTTADPTTPRAHVSAMPPKPRPRPLKKKARRVALSDEEEGDTTVAGHRFDVAPIPQLFPNGGHSPEDPASPLARPPPATAPAVLLRCAQKPAARDRGSSADADEDSEDEDANEGPGLSLPTPRASNSTTSLPSREQHRAATPDEDLFPEFPPGQMQYLVSKAQNLDTSDAPNWLKAVVARLRLEKSWPGTTCYKTLVPAFEAFELAEGFDGEEDNRRFPTVAERPEEIGAWIRRGRPDGRHPKIDDVPAYTNDLYTWYRKLQPGWRRKATSLPFSRDTSKFYWGRLCCNAKSGFFLLIQALSWGFTWAEDKASLKLLEDLAADMEWVLKAMTVVLQDRALRAKLDDPAFDDTVDLSEDEDEDVDEDDEDIRITKKRKIASRSMSSRVKKGNTKPSFAKTKGGARARSSRCVNVRGLLIFSD
ncbi:hypothetical protein PUNSTDRAFT_133776 [Punctularia strigosozonata HHB-11173 SS5]|uniref:uncharacterized protein n=1 Tax=Punctularia strigosozonata (strain HHB-11173) TaxID=741275 RepID=UPI0004418006|nr:uncharacterized protein PUNSTDRAFT_133776 [Punctularia strigosozonata HHB-11173 SS5]EIN10006.1 hypothetical protein PUNSTDRAFT_133776 [Punctularia strigosozonata HHB-11173 SS5]